MTELKRKIVVLISLLLPAFLSFYLTSCAESKSQISSVAYSLVFDFKSEKEPPLQRLCVFVRTSSEAQRVDSIKIVHKESGLSWNLKNPQVFSGNSVQYAYGINLCAPLNRMIPEGLYDVFYADAVGNEDTASFTLDYDSAIMTSGIKDVQKFIPGSSESMAVFDSDGELLYAGKKKSVWKDSSGILRDYKLASYVRKVVSGNASSILCVLPKEQLKNEN